MRLDIFLEWSTTSNTKKYVRTAPLDLDAVSLRHIRYSMVRSVTGTWTIVTATIRLITLNSGHSAVFRISRLTHSPSIVGHSVEDVGRGSVWNLLVANLKRAARYTPMHVIYCLSSLLLPKSATYVTNQAMIHLQNNTVTPALKPWVWTIQLHGTATLIIPSWSAVIVLHTLRPFDASRHYVLQRRFPVR